MYGERQRSDKVDRSSIDRSSERATERADRAVDAAILQYHIVVCHPFATPCRSFGILLASRQGQKLYGRQQ